MHVPVLSNVQRSQTDVQAPVTVFVLSLHVQLPVSSVKVGVYRTLQDRQSDDPVPSQV
jgi:hypothetical protein